MRMRDGAEHIQLTPAARVSSFTCHTQPHPSLQNLYAWVSINKSLKTNMTINITLDHFMVIN
jgi:hypothetical protein